MTTYSRLTLGSIEDLTDNETTRVGKGTMGGCVWLKDRLVITTPGKTREINAPERMVESSSGNFLGYVDRLLSEEGMYITGVQYRERAWHGLRPHKLEGTVYKDK